MKQIETIFKNYKKEKSDILKIIKNLIIECMDKYNISSENLKKNKKYEVFSTYPGCTYCYLGNKMIIQIKKEISYSDYGEYIDFNIYTEDGLSVREIFLPCDFKECIKKTLDKYDFLPKYYNLILDYIYSGKRFDTYSHQKWEKCIDNY